MLTDTLFGDISDGKLINLDKSWIVVCIVWAYLSAINTNSYCQGFKYRSWLIE